MMFALLPTRFCAQGTFFGGYYGSLDECVVCCVQAYLKADEAVLSQHCTPGCVQRLSGIIKAEVIDEVGLIIVLLILENGKFAALYQVHVTMFIPVCLLNYAVTHAVAWHG